MRRARPTADGCPAMLVVEIPSNVTGCYFVREVEQPVQAIEWLQHSPHLPTRARLPHPGNCVAHTRGLHDGGVLVSSRAVLAASDLVTPRQTNDDSDTSAAHHQVRPQRGLRAQAPPA